MEELIALLVVLIVLVVGTYALACLVVMVGAVGWFLSFPVLGVISLLLIAWPLLSYRRWLKHYPAWGWKFSSVWYRESEKIVAIGIVLAIIWGCALRDQLSTLWDLVSPYILRGGN